MIKYRLILALPFALLLLGATPRTLNGGCSIVIGADNGSTLADADIGPQADLCQVPDVATLLEIGVKADAGTPSVIMQRFRPNGATTVDLTSSALATGSSGAFACSRTSATTSVNGTTTCAATLQNTSLSKGDIIRTKTGASASTAKKFTVFVTWTW